LDVMNKKAILDEIAYNWALAKGNKSSPNWTKASNICDYYVNKLLPQQPRVGYKLTIKDPSMLKEEVICNSSWNKNRTLESDAETIGYASRLLVGFGENKTISGFVANALLSDIASKTTSAFAFFGGFVGNGNISRFIDLPDDAVVQDAYMELNAGGGFNLYINGVDCGLYTPSGGYMEANIKTSSFGACSFHPGRNTIDIEFTEGNITKSFIGGGFIQVRYKTSEFSEPYKSKFYFPGIKGFINLYSSFYIPTLWIQNLSGFLHYNRPKGEGRSLVFKVGDKTIYNSTDSGEVKAILNDSNFFGSTLFVPSDISGKTVPVRMFIEGENGTVDTVLITDLSNSMNKCMEPPEDELGKEIFIWIEAEDADHIELPMNITYGKYTSNEEYIHVPNNFGCGNGSANYTFNVDYNGDYRIWGRVLGLDSSSNSFYISVDNGPLSVWDIPSYKGWVWDIGINKIHLNKGKHTLRIICMEDGARIDKILITNNLTVSPPVWKGGGDRVPKNCNPNCSELGYCRYIDKGGWGFAYKDIVLEDVSTPPSCDGAQLILYFDEGTGSIVKDASGNGNDGTIYGARWTNGSFGYGLEFDGVDDYVKVLNSETLNPKSQVSVAFWIKTSSLARDRALLTKGSSDHTLAYWFYENSPTGIQFWMHNTKGPIIPTSSVADGNWHHIVGVFDGDYLHIYLDGKEVGTPVSATMYISDDDLGINAFGNGKYPAGKKVLDDIRIYSVALNDTEISKLYTSSPHVVSTCDPSTDPCCYRGCNISRYAVPYGSCIDGEDCCRACDPYFTQSVDFCLFGIQECCNFECIWESKTEVPYGSCDPTNASQCCIACDPEYSNPVDFCNVTTDECCSRSCNESTRVAVPYGSCIDGEDCCIACDPNADNIVDYCDPTDPVNYPCCKAIIMADTPITRQEYNDNCESVPTPPNRPCNILIPGDCPSGCNGDCINSSYIYCNFTWTPAVEVSSCTNIDADECHFSIDTYYARNMTDYIATIVEYHQANYTQANYSYYMANYTQANYSYYMANYTQANYSYYMANYTQAPAWFTMSNYSSADFVYYEGSEYSFGKYICRSKFWGDAINDSSWYSVDLKGTSSTTYSDWRWEDECDNCTQFYRKNFFIGNTSIITSLKLYVRSNEGSICYINDKRVGYDPTCHDDKYWNYITEIDPGVLKSGINILACAVKEGTEGEGFDAKLTANNDAITLIPSKSVWMYYHQVEECGKGCDPANPLNPDYRCEYGEFVENCEGYGSVLPWWSGSDKDHICPEDYCVYLGDKGYCIRCNITRIKLAKKLDKEFVDYTLTNSTGANIGLIGYGDDVCSEMNLNNNKSLLFKEIDTYGAKCGATCISCAIERGIKMLNSSTTGAKRKYMIVMSDGEANTCINSTVGTCDNSPYNATDAKNETITLACIAHNVYNITVYTIGFGSEAGTDTLNKTAICGGGEFYKSDNPDELKNIYMRIAKDIVKISQTVETEITNTTLYNDSYLEFDYKPIIPVGYGEVSITYKTDRFNDTVDCDDTIIIPSKTQINNLLDVKVTSYSADYWTDIVKVNNSHGNYTGFNLSDYGDQYFTLGDPYIVYINPNYFVLGENNTIKILTVKGTTEITKCSPDNRAIITVGIKAFSSTEEKVFPSSGGCNWTIEFNNGTGNSYFVNVTIPYDYTGSKKCNYANANITIDEEDAINYAVYKLLDQLDIDDDGRVDILFDFDDMEIKTIPTANVRSLWGPVEIKLVTWL